LSAFLAILSFAFWNPHGRDAFWLRLALFSYGTLFQHTGVIKGRKEPLAPLDNNITNMVDRGYRAFWERRGMKPPKVATTFVEATYQACFIDV